jgi:hypothetical protein
MSGSLDLSEFQETLIPVGQPPVRDPWAIPGGSSAPGGASSTMPGSPVPSTPSARISPVLYLVIGLAAVAVLFVGVRGLLDGLILTRDEAAAAFVQDCVDAAEGRDLSAITALLADDWAWDGADPAGDQRQDVALAALLEQIQQADVVSLALRSLEQTTTTRNAHISASLAIIVKTTDGTERHQADLDGWLRSTPEGWQISSLGITDLR